MSTQTPIIITFHCRRYDEIAPIAREYRLALQEIDDSFLNPRGDSYRGTLPSVFPAAFHFLDDLANKTGSNYDQEGGIHAWKFVSWFSEHEDIDMFAKLLSPFFAHVYSSKLSSGPADCHNILIIYSIGSQFDSNCTCIHAGSEGEPVDFDDFPAVHGRLPSSSVLLPIRFLKYELPFSWG